MITQYVRQKSTNYVQQQPDPMLGFFITHFTLDAGTNTSKHVGM